ncbi:Putative 12-oxophytodienoate reductase 11 [Fusarium oxysporum f. sp. cubense race 1]|uniref:Putative 12-oxophytodienoate reductase 11 n=1 Tax=Fusarium oxysporum f. sp. cubense (strain race 1) TaxID=1229664 RepID=N4UGP9_FUSC1|nr:Putative 12-oxophytodienoate reductase 11 [Fusarium oxysporum f. sp. cubense race 1]
MTASNLSVSQTSRLFKPLKLGRVWLSHRIVLAPLTRYRNDEGHVAMPFMKRYYADRASVPGTLIISEATGIAAGQEGQRYTPSFVSDAQVAAWKEIIDAVHTKGSFFFQQLWDLGRAADPFYMRERGSKYRSSSAVPMEGINVTPEAMTEEDIQQVIQNYVDTAERVMAAGGDGVEIHAAHGYLLDQFLSDQVNHRTDKWGGSIENRSRLALEVAKAVVDAVGAENVAIRLSPYASFQGAQKSDAKSQYLYLVQELKKLGSLAYLSLVEAKGDPAIFFANASAEDDKTLDFILEAWNNQSPVIVAGGYTPESAVSAVDDHYRKWDVLVAFGRHFLANPDLVFRVQKGLELNKYNRATFYSNMSEEGYNDYPFHEEFSEYATAA